MHSNERSKSGRVVRVVFLPKVRDEGDAAIHLAGTGRRRGRTGRSSRVPSPLNRPDEVSENVPSVPMFPSTSRGNDQSVCYSSLGRVESKSKLSVKRFAVTFCFIWFESPAGHGMYCGGHN
jgi:hypothetical protein